MFEWQFKGVRRVMSICGWQLKRAREDIRICGWQLKGESGVDMRIFEWQFKIGSEDI